MTDKQEITLPDPDGYVWHEGRMAPSGGYEAGFGFSLSKPEEVEGAVFSQEVAPVFFDTTVRRLIAEAVAAERERATEEANRRANASWSLMAKKMVAAEREACAKACEDRAGTVSMFANSKDARENNRAVRGCAAAIRSRGDQT